MANPTLKIVSPREVTLADFVKDPERCLNENPGGIDLMDERGHKRGHVLRPIPTPGMRGFPEGATFFDRPVSELETLGGFKVVQVGHMKPRWREPVKQPIVIRGTIPAGKAGRVPLLRAESASCYPFNSAVDSYNMLPAFHHFYWYGYSLYPSLESDRASVLALWEHGRFLWRFASSTYRIDPLRHVMGDPRELPSLEGKTEFAFERHARFNNVTVSDHPIQIVGLEVVDPVIELPEALEQPVTIELVLHGVLLQPDNDRLAGFDHKALRET